MSATFCFQANKINNSYNHNRICQDNNKIFYRK
uniref:Uncharacterized protein n=1 Tax=Anguilla anguilla TaxID=7936 RepID=A0A0E9XV63_ANGAN